MSYRILGSLDSQPGCHLPESYFKDRDCFIDCRWSDHLIIDKTVNLGYEVKFIVGTHNTSPDKYGDVQTRKIIIHPKVWIASFSMLFNCEIGEGAIVALGSVIRSMDVEPYTMVAGNPAKVIKAYDFALQDWIPVTE